MTSNDNNNNDSSSSSSSSSSSNNTSNLRGAPSRNNNNTTNNNSTNNNNARLRALGVPLELRRVQLRAAVLYFPKKKYKSTFIYFHQNNSLSIKYELYTRKSYKIMNSILS